MPWMPLNLKFFSPVLLLATILCTSQPAQAAVDQDLQLWTPVILDCKIYKRFRGYFEVVPRIGENVYGLNQLIVRPGFEYRHRDNLSLMGGYAWVSNYRGDNVTNEHRLWQQVLAAGKFKNLTIINRTRLEERMFENTTGAGVRLRHMIKLNYPITKRLYATTSNELFINLNSVRNGPQAGIDQNRLFVGLGVKAHKKARVEIGYQYQYVNRSDQFDDLANHAIVIQSFIGIRD